MSTKKDLTELLSYTVKKAEAATEIKVAWAGLSNLEKILVKKASDNGRAVNLDSIRRISALVEKKACPSSCSMGGKRKGKKGAMYKKSAARSRMVTMLKRASARPAFRQLLKSAEGGPWSQAMAAKTGPEFLSKSWAATPGYARALIGLLAAGGALGTAYGLSSEAAKRWDRGVDPAMKGIGLDRDLANAIREQIGKATSWASELGGIRRGFREAYAPLYGIA